MLGDSPSSFWVAEACLGDDDGDAEAGLNDEAPRMFRVSTVVFIVRDDTAGADGGGEVEAVAITLAIVCIRCDC